MSTRSKPSLATLPPDTARDMLARLDAGESLSTADFAACGQGMERFLRYAQLSPRARAKFHADLGPHLKRRAAA